jgi:hypothetical protein
MGHATQTLLCNPEISLWLRHGVKNWRTDLDIQTRSRTLTVQQLSFLFLVSVLFEMHKKEWKRPNWNPIFILPDNLCEGQVMSHRLKFHNKGEYFLTRVVLYNQNQWQQAPSWSTVQCPYWKNVDLVVKYHAYNKQ